MAMSRAVGIAGVACGVLLVTIGYVVVLLGTCGGPYPLGSIPVSCVGFRDPQLGELFEVIGGVLALWGILEATGLMSGVLGRHAHL
jgi:hypothetical protein